MDECFQLIQFTIAVALTFTHLIELICYMLLFPVPVHRLMFKFSCSKADNKGKKGSGTDQSLLSSLATLLSTHSRTKRKRKKNHRFNDCQNTQCICFPEEQPPTARYRYQFHPFLINVLICYYALIETEPVTHGGLCL